MKMQIRVLALLALALVSALMIVGSANANAVPTRTQSSYGMDGPSFIQATGSSTSEAVLIDSQSLCPFSLGSPTSSGSCDLSYAYQFDASTPLPAGATSLTITVEASAGTFLPLDTSFGILTDDNSDSFGGYNVFHSDNLSDADIATLNGEGAISLTINQATGVASITINLLDLPSGASNGLAFYLDVASDTDGDPFTCNPSGTPNVCTDLPAAPSPMLDITTTQKTPEPGALVCLASAVGLLGFYRRRWAR